MVTDVLRFPIAEAAAHLSVSVKTLERRDYRYCWLRDAALTLHCLVRSGYTDEACGFRDWMLRAAAGEPEAIQIMYGPPANAGSPSSS